MKSTHFAQLAELANEINHWCGKRSVVPANSQTAKFLSERNIRYYRTLGLLDGPLSGGGYGRRHFLQLAAIRVLQARGMPLKRIQELLYGRDDASLEELLRRAKGEPAPVPAFPAFSTESWNITNLGGAFALISRDGIRPTAAQVAAITEILSTNPTKKANRI